MPLTVAPPSRNGDAAQGHRLQDAPAFAASDQAGVPESAPPAPSTRAAIARTVAAGVLLSAGALIPAASVVLVPATFRFAFSADERLTFGGVASVLVTLAFALAYAATLALPAWPWSARRPATLLLAAIVTLAWPLSGFPLPAALAAIVAVALALARDRRTPGGPRATGPWPAVVLVAAALAAAIGGLSLAQGHKLHVETPSAAAEPGGGAPEHRAKADADATGADPHSTPALPVEGAAAPPATDAPPLADEATAFVRDYYAALNDRRFADAWASLSPAVRAAFGGFAHWRAGYARTVSSRPQAITVRADGETTIVEHRLAARDRGCEVTRSFQVTWRLARVADAWQVTRLRGSALAGPRCP